MNSDHVDRRREVTTMIVCCSINRPTRRCCIHFVTGRCSLKCRHHDEDARVLQKGQTRRAKCSSMCHCWIARSLATSLRAEHRRTRSSDSTSDGEERQRATSGGSDDATPRESEEPPLTAAAALSKKRRRARHSRTVAAAVIVERDAATTTSAASTGGSGAEDDAATHT